MKIRPKRSVASKLPLAKARIRHFKAVRDSGVVTFTPLTVFIGNNGVGKSSLIEALEALRQMSLYGLYSALERWRGFDHIWNKASDHSLVENQVGRLVRGNPMRFWVSGNVPSGPYEAVVEVNTDKETNRVFFSRYAPATRDEEGEKIKIGEKGPDALAGERITDPALSQFVGDWLFLDLSPGSMLYPRLKGFSATQSTTLSAVGSNPIGQSASGRLLKDGSNIADYLLDFAERDPAGFAGLVDTIRTVLPYAEDLRASITSELERSSYLALKETGINERIYGWLLSQGTLRITALLAVFRHPNPPNVIFVEELENGLDPRTLHLVIEEIRQFVESGHGQVIITTHSPYLLDLLHLSQIVVVERDKTGAPTFRRPATDTALKEWAKDFAPGQLYTMGKLTREGA